MPITQRLLRLVEQLILLIEAFWYKKISDILVLKNIGNKIIKEGDLYVAGI